MNGLNENIGLFQFIGTIILLVVILVGPMLYSYTGLAHECNISIFESYQEELLDEEELEKKEKKNNFEEFGISTYQVEQCKGRTASRLPIFHPYIFRNFRTQVPNPPPEHPLV